MINRTLLLLLLVLPWSAGAEIYKWKDSNGVVRYSDVPPPSNVPRESIGAKKIGAPATPAPPAEPAPAPAAANKSAPNKDASAPPSGRESEAIKRQENAEKAKKEEVDKQAELQRKQQNCITAKSNMQSYKQGGRIAKINEKGEREYLSDEDFAKGMQEAQKQIDENCQ